MPSGTSGSLVIARVRFKGFGKFKRHKQNWNSNEERYNAYSEWSQQQREPVKLRKMEQDRNYNSFDKKQKGTLYMLSKGCAVRESTIEKMNIVRNPRGEWIIMPSKPVKPSPYMHQHSVESYPKFSVGVMSMVNSCVCSAIHAMHSALGKLNCGKTAHAHARENGLLSCLTDVPSAMAHAHVADKEGVVFILQRRRHCAMQHLA